MTAFSTDMTAAQWLKAHREHLMAQLAEAAQQAGYWERRRDDLVQQVAAANRLVDGKQ